MKEIKISRLIKQKEDEETEHKISLSQINEIAETVSAFSNTKGGQIIVGISNSGRVIGVDIGKDTMEKLANKISQNTDPKIHPRILVKEVDGKKIIIIDVKPSLDKLVLAFGRPYKRVGRATHKMSKDEYERGILEKYRDKLQFDTQFCKKAKLKDIDPKKVRWFLEKAREARGFDVPIKLKELVEKGVLVHIGKGRATKYIIKR